MPAHTHAQRQRRRQNDRWPAYLPTVGRWSLGGGLRIPDEPPNERPPPPGGQPINLRRPSQGSASPRFGCKQQEALLGTRVPGRLSLSEDWRAECGVLTLFIGLGLGSKKRGYRSEKRAESGNHLFLALSRGPGGYHLFLALSRGPGGYHRYPVWPLS